MFGRLTNPLAGSGKYALISLLLLLPCYWQPRVQGGDISSHIDNSWTAQWVETGGSDGLSIVHRTTNVLFDLLLGGLFRICNAELALRLAVSIAVLTFAWGAFAFVSVVAGRRPWHLLSCIAIFAYGWAFHMGFFSFYLSLGLCFWVLALVWEPGRWQLAVAAPLAVLAYVAHALPFLWMAGLVAYLWMARRVSPKVRAYVTASSLLAILVLHVWVGQAVVARWSPAATGGASAPDPGWMFDGKYYLVAVGLMVAWGLMFLEMLHAGGARKLVGGLPFQICLLSAMSVVILPAAVMIPGFSHALVYTGERMSLGVGICVCAFLGGARPRAQIRYALLLVALLFFGFLYGDERKLNSYEDRRQDTVAEAAQPWTSRPAAVSITDRFQTIKPPYQ